MIEFIHTHTPTTQPTFADVKVNQFFVSIDGYLCQKRNSISFCAIAASTGKPYSDFFTNIAEDSPIERILPAVECVNF